MKNTYSKMFYVLIISILSIFAFSSCNSQVSETNDIDLTKNIEETEVSTKVVESNMQYLKGTGEDYERLIKESKPFAVFFHAAWCGECRKLEKNITENWASLPEEAILLQVDFDTETELKKKYDITFQTTFVFINSNGEKAGKTLANPSMESLVKAYEGIL